MRCRTALPGLLATLLLTGPLHGQSRPLQDRRPALPYDEYEVTYPNAQAGLRLAGTLSLPQGAGPFAAVVLVSGSGMQDRDGEMAGHAPFLVLADHLTRQGLAVLRYDDRGVGRSEGDFAGAAVPDFVEDALAGVEYLAGQPRVDARRIGLVGHSEGGLVAALAAGESPQVAFIVLMAAPAIPGTELLPLQQMLLGRAAGAPPTDLAIDQLLSGLYFEVLIAAPDPLVAEAGLRRIWNEFLAGQIVPDGLQPEEREALWRWLLNMGPAEREALTQRSFEAQLPLLLSPAFRFLLAYDPAPALEQVSVPVLALNGSLDLQVPAHPNLDAAAAALEAGGNPDYTIVELPRLNHLFQTAVTGSPLEHALLPETLAPAALQIIGTWIVERAERAATATAVAWDAASRPSGPDLGPPWPNPFNAAVELRFHLPAAGAAELRVFDVAGQPVATLLCGPAAAGEHRATWDGRDAAGQPAASGAYVVCLRTAGHQESRRLLLLR